MMILLSVAFILGIVIGSFLNVCIYRIPEGESINLPRSHCQYCKHTLGALDLIPLLSYLALGGKCRYCKQKISMQYMLIEMLNGCLYVWAIANLGITTEGILACILISFIIVLTLIDMRYMLLPTNIIITGTVFALGVRGGISMLHNDLSILLQGVYGGIVGYVIVAIIFYASLLILKKEGMGYGDVRYLGMIGCFTAWQSVLLTLFIASLVASVYGIIQLYVRKRSEAFPFGPFLSIGALICIFYADPLIRGYLELF